MPELPEVETTRRHIAPVIEGSTVADVDVRRARMVRRQERPADFAERLIGRRVIRCGRHGKFIVTSLKGDLSWIIHLGMSGRLAIAGPGDSEAPHTNIVVRLSSGDELRMVDPRTFGFMAVFTDDEIESGTLGRLGPDALLDLPRSPDLARRMARRHIAVKALLLDQGFLAGLGNIYADEVLHRSKIHPLRSASSLSGVEIKRLRGSVRPVLEAGLAHGGTSLDDLAYLLPDGRAGDYLQRLRVYGRTGEPCRRCGTAISRVVVAGRGTHYCGTCQS